jgi:hypothetical protein
VETVEFVASLGKQPGAREIPRAKRDQPLPLTYVQEVVWFFYCFQGDAPKWGGLDVLPVDGPLQVKILERVMNELIRRHETLRTTYKSSSAGPVQVVHDYQYRELPVVDLSALKESLRESESKRLIWEDVHRSFDLERGPVLRNTLLQLAADKGLIIHNVHHMATDGLSDRILRREIGILHEAFSSGQDSPLIDPPIQFADYVAWLRGRLQGEIFEKYLEFFRKQVAGVRLLHLPTDHAQPEIPVLGTAAQGTWIRPALVSELKALGGGITAFMAFLAGVTVLINKWGGEEDIAITVPVAGRSRTEAEGIVGHFAGATLIRVNLSGDPTVNELLRQARDKTLEAWDHQDMPFNVALAADFRALLKHYSSQERLRLRLVKYITREFYKTITTGKSLKTIILALPKRSTLRSLNLIARGLMKNTTFQLLKSIWRGSPKNVTLKSLVAGRSREEFDAWIRLGTFLIELRPDLVREILEEPRVKAPVNFIMESLFAYGVQGSAHVKVLETIRKAAQPGRSLGRDRTHIFLDWLSAPRRIEQRENVKSELAGMKPDTAGEIGDLAISFGLKVNVSENNQGLRIQVIFSRDAFEPETITRFLKDLERVLEEFLRNPAKRISELDVGRPQEVPAKFMIA